LIPDKIAAMNQRETGMLDELLDERGLSKLKWRCRRGLLENDLFIERFFKRYEDSLTVKQSQALGALMDLSDNDLLDLHLSRKTLMQVAPALDREDVREVLEMLKSKENR
jgi:antitoxin CptB